jgi:hypothetical protein
MRSRYSAFAVGDAGYLLRTWHPSGRPRKLSLDPALRWTRLAVLETRAGGLFDATGMVQFRLAERCGLDAAAIWEWGVVERVASGLRCTQINLQPLGRHMLMAADRLATL